MGPRSKIRKTIKPTAMSSKRGSSYYFYAVLGICIAGLPLLVVASQIDDGLVVGASDQFIESDDLEAAESQHVGVAAAPSQVAPSPVQTAPIPAVAPAPAAVHPESQAQPFIIPKSDLAGAPSYGPNPRYAVPPVNPYREFLPYEVAKFRRRAQAEDEPAEDDYQPSESKGKKSSPSIFKRVTGSIRSAGKAVVGAPSFIYKRYRGTWKKYFGGGKKKKGWKSWSSSSDKQDGGWGWEETEPTDEFEPSHYPSDKGWRSSTKGWTPAAKGSDYDSNERRYDREYSNYRERPDDDYDNRPSKPRDKKWTSSYREETHYDEYDGKKTTASYGGPSRKPSSSPGRRPSSSSSNYRQYNDDY